MAKVFAVVVVVAVLLLLAVCAGLLLSYWPLQGSCGDKSHCLQMQECYDLHQEGEPFNDVLLLSCSDRADRVCCPVGNHTQVDPESSRKLLPMEECGPAIDVRIREGQEADLGMFPWMALIAYKSTRLNVSVDYPCGGTLISERYVLTAAHCMKHGFPMYVRLGEHDLSQEKDCLEDFCADPPVDIEVEKVIAHKQYNRPFLKNDIALIRLKTKAPRTEFISSVCLPFGINVTGDEENKKYTVAGWGTVGLESSINNSDTLQYTRVPSSAVSECNEAQPREVQPIADLQLCAGGWGDHDVCKGDSGGPLMDTRADKHGTIKIFQVGIVSFGSEPCGGPIPSVYTRVSAYLDWILSNLEP